MKVDVRLEMTMRLSLCLLPLLFSSSPSPIVIFVKTAFLPQKVEKSLGQGFKSLMVFSVITDLSERETNEMSLPGFYHAIYPQGVRILKESKSEGKI